MFKKLKDIIMVIFVIAGISGLLLIFSTAIGFGFGYGLSTAFNQKGFSITVSDIRNK